MFNNIDRFASAAARRLRIGDTAHTCAELCRSINRSLNQLIPPLPEQHPVTLQIIAFGGWTMPHGILVRYRHNNQLRCIAQHHFCKLRGAIQQGLS